MKNSEPKSQPKKLSPMEEQLTMLTTHCLQLERVIWLMAQEQGGAMLVDEANLNPLWTTKFDRVENSSTTLLKITADSLPEPTDSQLAKLARLLDGKSEESTPEALLQVGMSGYPPSYVVARLAPLVQCKNGKWSKS